MAHVLLVLVGLERGPAQLQRSLVEDAWPLSAPLCFFLVLDVQKWLVPAAKVSVDLILRDDNHSVLLLRS